MPAKQHTRVNTADFLLNLALENGNATKDRVLDPSAAIPSALSFDTPGQELFFNRTTDTRYGTNSPANKQKRKRKTERKNGNVVLR